MLTVLTGNQLIWANLNFKLLLKVCSLCEWMCVHIRVCACTCARELANNMLMCLICILHCFRYANWEMFHHFKACGGQEVVANSPENYSGPFCYSILWHKNIYLVYNNNRGGCHWRWICYADFLKENKTKKFLALASIEMNFGLQ